MLDGDTKGHLALGSALVDCLAVAGMTFPQAEAFSLVAMDEGRSVSEYAERAGASHPNMTRRLLLTQVLLLAPEQPPRPKFPKRSRYCLSGSFTGALGTRWTRFHPPP
jgi:hypothetical protein